MCSFRVLIFRVWHRVRAQLVFLTKTQNKHTIQTKEKIKNNNFANFCKPPPPFCGTNADQNWRAMLILRQMHTFCRSNSHNPKNQVTFYSTLTTLKKQHQMEMFFPDYPGPFCRIYGTWMTESEVLSRGWKLNKK